MERRHLRYFTVLAEELHFTRAAERLNISAPTLSVQIQEIERQLAAQLFERSKRSVALTPVGEVFLKDARQVLEAFERAEHSGQRAGRGEIGSIDIGYVGSASYSGVLQEQMKRFARHYPDLALDAREYPMAELPTLVADRQLDIAFVRMPMALPNTLRSRVLFQDQFCLAVQATHVAARSHTAIRPAEFANESFIVPEQEAGTYEFARRGRFTPNILARPGSLLAVLTQVSLGAGVSIMPSSVRAVTLPGVGFRQLPGKAIVSEIAAIHRASDNPPAVRNFIQQIRTSPVRRDPFSDGATPT